MAECVNRQIDGRTDGLGLVMDPIAPIGYGTKKTNSNTWKMKILRNISGKYLAIFCYKTIKASENLD